MAAFSDYCENLVMDWLFTGGAATRPTAWYVSLHTSAPTDAAPSTGELSGNGYARQSVSFGAASGGIVSNSADITFGPNTTAPWGTVTHCAVWDAVSAGNCLMHGALSSSVAIAVNDSLKIAAGDLDLSVD